MAPKTRRQKKAEEEGTKAPDGAEDSVIADTTLKGKKKRRSGSELKDSSRQSETDSQDSDEIPVNKPRLPTPTDFRGDIKMIENLETKLAEMKSKRDLELLDESANEESLTEEIDQLHEDRLKLEKDDPLFTDLGEKLGIKRKELKALGVANRKAEIAYEKEYRLATAQLNFYKNKFRERCNEGSCSSASTSSLTSTKKNSRTQKWVDNQMLNQEAEDLKAARKLQRELDKEAEEIERMKIALEKKKEKLRSVGGGSVIFEAMPPPRAPSAPWNLASNSERMLAAMFARQGSGKDLPHFSGSPEQWIRFKSEFYRTTEQCGFSNSENLSRLERCLKGEAFFSVKSLFSLPENVPEIMRRLQDIFGNPEIIIRNLLVEIKQIPMVKEGRPEGLVEFGTAVMNLTATLKSLQRPEHLNNPLIVTDLQEKLPYQEKLRWIKDSMYGGRDLISFSNWLEDEVRSARMLCLPKTFVKPEERREKEPRQRFQKNTGRCLAVSEKSASQGKDKDFQVKKFDKNNRPCFLCKKEGHWVSRCPIILEKTPEERFKLVNGKGICTSCLVSGHAYKTCRKKRECGKNGCKKDHHPLLHKEEAQSSQNSEAAGGEITEEIVNTLHSGVNTLMGALPVVLSGPEGDVRCLAFIDSGSTVTLLKHEIAEKLGLQGPRQPFCLKTFLDDKRFKDSRVTSLKIKGIGRKAREYCIEGVRTVEAMPIGKLSQNAEKLKTKYPYLKTLPLATFDKEEPGILIGMPQIHLFNTPRSVGRDPDLPLAMQCPLGWRLGGVAGEAGIVDNFHVCNQMSVEDDLTELIRKSFSTEDFGVKAAPTLQSKETEACMKIFEETTKRVPGTDRFETGLLWRDKDVILPESREMALHRLYCQERKMDKNPEFAKAYCAKIEENMGKGFYKKLTPEEAAVRTARTWYLPHFGVWNPNKPGKLRLVMDAKAKSRGISLNDVLMSGPDFNNSLLAVLWRFRQRQYAYCGDIKDMYHRVFLKTDEQDSQRFLWRGMRRDIPPEEYKMIVLTFGSKCSPSSAQYVKNLNAEENRDNYPEACKAIKEDNYVDDGLGSKSTLEEAKKIVKDIILVNKKAGFTICNWNANFAEILEDIDDELKCAEIKEIGDRDDNAAERVLGLWWDSRRDEFTFRLKMHKVPKEILEKTKRPTKRDVLRVTMSVFDPLGFVAHLSVKPKILIQALWTRGLGWDEEIPEDLVMRWNTWLDELQGISSVRIPRCYSYFIPVADSVGLHVFCDASEKAFAAIAFLRVQYGEIIEVNIVGSKTRVAPLKVLSIPRLELQAAVMGTRLGCAINEQLDIKINSTTLWTDSMTVLKWIRSDARSYKPFVAHRIGEILDGTTVAQWRHVPTKQNVADDATRNSEPSDLSPESRWFTGPAFLRQDQTQWPKEPEDLEASHPQEDSERRAVVLVISTEEPIIQFNRFDRLYRLLRVMATVLRMVGMHRFHRSDEEFTVEELKKAELELVRLGQQESFPEELRTLNGGKSDVGKKSRIWRLEPFLDKDGILRVRGRLGRSKEDVEFRQPAILEGSHHLTKLILQSYHEECAHQGQRTVAYLARQKYWITGGMNTVKKTFHDCLRCQRRKARLCEARMADLPLCRLQMERPFHNTGMDYFGPIIVKVGRRTEKRWGVIFTCLATRAVHLEIAHSLSTDSAIIAVTGLASRRGRPRTIFSDNGTNFHGAQNELKKALEEMDSKEMGRRLAMREMQWFFNPPAAPHMGGAWERLVGSTKRTMEGILKDQHPSDETLRGVFYEVEYILNSRPLMEVPVDPTDPQPLTPNQILIGWQGGSKEDLLKIPVWGQFEDRDLYARKSWRVAQRLADQFWSRWQKEYLPTLNKRAKWFQTKDPIKQDDVVLVIDDAAPRNTWPLGRIVSVFPGKDGEVRMVDVKTANGIYRRPISKLVKLHLDKDEASSSGGRIWERRADSSVQKTSKN